MAARGKARKKPVRKMTRAGGGKHKGGEFEREVCRKLSMWVSKGQNQDVFWRSAMSGGRATVARKRGVMLNRQAGDICAVAPEGHVFTNEFYLETKHYKDLQIASFLLQDVGRLAKFWRETEAHAKAYNKAPILIAKQNFVPVLFIANYNAKWNWPAPRIKTYCGVGLWLLNDIVGEHFEMDNAKDTDHG